MASTIPGMFLERVEASRASRCYTAFTGGRWRDFTWEEFEEQARELGLGLLELGLRRKDVVAVLGNTCREWATTDLGALGAGAVTVGLYPTLAPEGVGSMHYVIDHSEARFLIVESLATLKARIEPILGKIPRIEKILLWSWDPKAAELDPRCIPFEDVCAKGRALHQRDPSAWKNACMAAKADEVAILIYTSGTTGQPKGAMLSHGNVTAMQDAFAEITPAKPLDTTINFLPMAHAAERVVAHYGRIRNGIATLYARSLETLLEDFPRAKPTVFGSVPRIFEKIHARVTGEIGSAKGMKGVVARAAFRAGMQAWRIRKQGGRPGPLTRTLDGIFQLRVVEPLRAKLGGRIEHMVSGAAPIAVEILEFFDACGIQTFEAYGLTETCAVLTINRPDALRYGTVGKPVPGAQVKIASDGEILARGPTIFKGYFKDPEATREAFTDDGWFKTGDIGAFDGDGFLRITDRKKNILITAAGKNITPSNIETEVKSAHPLISYCHLHADRRAYPVALICLDPDQLAKLAREKGLRGTTAAELKDDPAVRAVVQQAVDRANERSGQFERIRKFAILPREFSVDGGELTPTLKTKRKEVDKRYAAVLDALYAEGEARAA